MSSKRQMDHLERTASNSRQSVSFCVFNDWCHYFLSQFESLLKSLQQGAISDEYSMLCFPSAAAGSVSGSSVRHRERVSDGQAIEDRRPPAVHVPSRTVVSPR